MTRLEQRRADFFTAHPDETYCFHCPCCRKVYGKWELVEKGLRYCGVCGLQFPPTLPLWPNDGEMKRLGIS